MGSPIFPPSGAGGGSGDLTLGETSTTAYRGDRGKTAYDHSQVAHAPAAAEQNVNADWDAVSGDAQILNKPAIPDAYTLPTAAADTLGGVKIGDGIAINTGVISAPPRENLIINGDFSVAQRGTSFTSATWRTNADDSYLLDRWLLLSDGNDIVDVSQVEGAFSRFRYALQAEVETANKRFGFCQIIEANSCIPLRGQKISISFAAKTATSKVINNVRVAVLEWTSTADTVTSDVVSSWSGDLTFAANWAALNTPANLALTTSEQTFKVEGLTVGATCNNLAVFVWVDDTDCAVDDILQLGEVQIVRGSVVPEFVARDDLAKCKLRFFTSYPNPANIGTASQYAGQFAIYQPFNYTNVTLYFFNQFISVPTVILYVPGSGASGLYDYSASAVITPTGMSIGKQIALLDYSPSSYIIDHVYGMHFTAEAEL